MSNQTLIDDLKAATEGSAELDARIQALEYGEEFVKLDDGPRGSTHPNDPFSVCWITASGERYTCWWNKAYTRVVDAALTLIPEEWFLILHDLRWTRNPLWDVSLQKILPGSFKNVGATAVSVPLTICIAALLAREADETP